MTIQNYLMINKQNNTVENIIVWDGNTSNWNPPSEYLLLPQATTPTMIWNATEDAGSILYDLIEQNGFGDIGYTWDGTKLTTNKLKPIDVQPQANQPQSNGTQPA